MLSKFFEIKTTGAPLRGPDSGVVAITPCLPETKVPSVQLLDAETLEPLAPVPKPACQSYTLVSYHIARTIDTSDGKRKLIRARATIVKLKGKKGHSGSAAVPRSIEVTPRVRQIFRYICNGAQTPANITYGDLLGVAGGICSVVNSTIKLIATSMRIVSVTCWPPVAVSGSNPSVCELNWVGANADQTPDLAYNETLPSGTATPGVLSYTPPRASLAADWFNNAVTLADVLFTLYTGQGTLIDLEVEYTQPNGFAATAISIASGVLGTFYYLTLNHSGSKNIYPATLPSTT